MTNTFRFRGILAILFITSLHGLTFGQASYDSLKLIEDFKSVEALMTARKYEEALSKNAEIRARAYQHLKPSWVCYATARATGTALHLRTLNIPNADDQYALFNSSIDSMYTHQRSQLNIRAVEALNYLTLLHIRAKLYDRAIELTRLQVRRLRELDMARGLKLAIPLSNRAMAFENKQQSDSNIYYINAVLDEVEKFKTGQTRWKEIMLNNLANAYKGLGEPERALVYMEASQELAKQDSSQSGQMRVITRKHNMAAILSSLNRPKDALQVFREVESLYKTNNFQNAEYWGRLYESMALCLSELEDTSSATFFRKSYEWFSKDPNLTTQAEVAHVKFLHKKRKQKKDVSQEIRSAKQIIKKQRERGDSSSYDFATVNMFLGHLYFQMKYYDSAYAVTNQVLSIIEAQKVEFSEAQLHDPIFKKSFADQLFQQALDLKSSVCLEQYKLHQKISKLEEAKGHIENAMNHLNHLRNSRLYGTSKTVDFDFSLKTHETGLKVCKYLLSQEYDTTNAQLALNLFESAKSLLLSQSVHDKRVKKRIDIPDSLAEGQLRLLKKIEETQTNISSLNGDTTGLATLRKILIADKLKLDTLKALIRDQYPSYDAYRKQFNTVRLKQLQQEVLDNETAMIQYFVGTWSVYALAITSDGVFLDSAFISKEVVDGLSNFHKLTSSAPEITTESFESQFNDYLSIGNFAFNTLFTDGVLQYIAGKKKLIIVPYGSLNYVPFEALLTEKIEKTEKVNYANLPYLMNQFDIQYAYSATWLHQHKDHKTGKLSYLGVAPSYDVEYMKNSDVLIPFRAFRNDPTPLTGNLIEIERTQEIMGGEALIGDMATEQNFRSRSKNHSILHFAMHGLMDNNRPMNSQLLFSSGQDTVDDGSLFAYELYGLPLNADLVVMTACNSGNGKLEQGEGVMSLARAFSDAGCPSLVTSLWQVDDLSASDLVTDFFKNIQKGESKSSSLRDAKLRYLKTAEPARTHPFYWANLIVMGNDQPLVKKRGLPIWWMIVGGVTLIFVLGMTFRKKAAAKAA